MGFSQQNGYDPASIQTIMTAMMEEVNAQFGTSYTWENFVGTNCYKFLYVAAQRVQKSEVKTSEIFLKLQQYITLINERISRPANTNPGIIDKFLELGYIVSVKKMVEVDAGKINVCVDIDETGDDYAEEKLAICQLLSVITAGGIFTQGTEEETIVLSNGQAFDYKFHLPDRIEVLLRLTVTLSENNQMLIGIPDDVKLKLLTNIIARYRLGLNFEPQKYFAVSDAPWASQVVLEWSDDDGATWSTDVFDADFDQLFIVLLENIELIEE